MTTHHTPGPWGRREHDNWSVDGPSGGVALSTAAIGVAKRPYPIALVIQRDRRSFGDGDAEHDANLALVSAAPDLLDALRAAQAALAMMTAPDAIKSTSVQHAWARAVEAETKARSAIAKATGASQ